MRLTTTLYLLAVLTLWLPSNAIAENMLIEDFKNQPEARWRVITDTVMGGVSTGQVEFIQEDGETHAHMTGRVSTENNGGFVQIRIELSSPPPENAAGLRLIVRGNNQRYFVHLRTEGTVLPWQYYQAGFEVTEAWSEVFLPFTDFVPSGWLLRSVPKPESLKSIGIVAFGRDHEAEVDLREIAYF